MPVSNSVLMIAGNYMWKISHCHTN